MVAKSLPANVTSLIQPMDQGVILLMKQHYRNDLIKSMCNEGDDLIQFWKK